MSKEKREIIGVFIKDTHLHQKTVEINKSIYQQVILLCKQYSCPLFHGGDVFTSRIGQPLEVLNTFSDILGYLEEACVTMHVIEGNHDKVNQEDERSYISPFERHPNIKLYSKQESVEFNHDTVVHFMPYFKEGGSYAARLATLKPVKDKFNLCLTHVAVQGVKNNDGSAVENDIKPNLFDQFDFTMVAHYHDESWVGSKVWYFPSCYQANFGETPKKGCVLLYADHTTEFVPLEFPTYVKLTVDIADTKRIKQLQKEYANRPENVRIVFTGDETQMASLNQEKFAALGIDVKFERGVVRQDLSAVLEASVSFNRGNIAEAFAQFCELKGYEDNQTGLDYLEKL